jgi:transposase
MQAIHGGTATNDRIDAQNIAVLLRGGLIPPAYVSPAERRAPRALLRRRIPCMRNRAELLPHVQQNTRQYNLPAIGKKMAEKAKRASVAERFSDPAGPQRIAVALALIDHSDGLRRARARTSRKTTKQHEANTLSLLRTVPGSGASLRLGLLEAIHDSARCPRGPALVSYGHLVQCAKASAGKRYGPSSPPMGKAYLPWAFSEAAVLWVRATPAGQKYLARLEQNHGQGKAWTVRAQQCARAVYDLCHRGGAGELNPCVHGSGSGAGEPAASLGHSGGSLATVLGHEGCPCVDARP